MTMSVKEGQYFEVLMTIRYYLVENGLMQPDDDFDKMPDIVESLILGDDD
jgi:hypothetical protein